MRRLPTEHKERRHRGKVKQRHENGGIPVDALGSLVNHRFVVHSTPLSLLGKPEPQRFLTVLPEGFEVCSLIQYKAGNVSRLCVRPHIAEVSAGMSKQSYLAYVRCRTDGSTLISLTFRLQSAKASAMSERNSSPANEDVG